MAATGYSSAVVLASNVRTVFPAYADYLGTQSFDALTAEVYARNYRRVLKKCRDDGYEPNQILDSSVFKTAEAFCYLWIMFEQFVGPTGDMEATMKLADYWRKRYEDEIMSTTWEYDTSVTADEDDYPDKGRPMVTLARC